MELRATANLTTSDALNFLQSMRLAFGDGSESYEEFFRVMSDYAEQKIDVHALIVRVKILFRGHQELIPGFNTFLPEEFKIKLPLEKEMMPVVFGDMALCFVNSFRNRFREDEHVYRSYIGIMREVQTRKISFLDTYNEVVSLLEGHQDLIEQFTQLINYSASTASQQALSKGSLSPRDEKKPSEPAMKQPLRRNKPRTSSGCPQMNWEKKGRHVEKEKDSPSETLMEIDVTKCCKCTPSYRHLPKGYRSVGVSKRTKLGAAVLNDDCVTISSGSEADSYKPVLKNKYEERLFDCEDVMFHFDMLVELVNETTQKAEDLRGKLDKTPKQGSVVCIEDHFLPRNLRCIENLYGDYGLEVLDLLSDDVRAVLPCVLARLKQKKVEYSRCREEYCNIASVMFAKNHHKSLGYSVPEDVKQ